VDRRGEIESMGPENKLMTLHAGVMPVTQQRMLRSLAAFAEKHDFYLAGGTAIAIQLGHRRSLDLDWFTAEKIRDPHVLVEELRRTGVNFEARDVADGTLHGLAGGMNLSFLEYRYPALAAHTEWQEYGCRLASLTDLACMKLSAIGGRGSKKDFVDLLALGRKFSLDQMLSFYREKFNNQDIGHTLVSLSYFDDADEEEMPQMYWDVQWEDAKRTIEEWVREYLQRQAPPKPEGGSGSP
jgi:Nucleotidyl transferase AbiEii toxin, Type IV TA system